MSGLTLINQRSASGQHLQPTGALLSTCGPQAVPDPQALDIFLCMAVPLANGLAYAPFEHSTTSASYQDMLTLTPDTAGRRPRDHRHRRRQSHLTTISGYAQPLRDSTTVSEVVRSHRATPAINTCASSASRRWRRPRPHGSGGARVLVLRQQVDAVGHLDHLKVAGRAETSGTTVNVGNLAIAVLRLDAMPASARRQFMVLRCLKDDECARPRRALSPSPRRIPSSGNEP